MRDFLTTNEALIERLRATEKALVSRHPLPFGDGIIEFWIKTYQVEFLARGEYYNDWLIRYTAAHRKSRNIRVPISRRVVIREPNSKASQYPFENEIAVLTYLARYHPSIPVPKIYTYSIRKYGANTSFMALEYVQGQPLYTVWDSLSIFEKDSIVNEIVQIIAELSDKDFGCICGLTLKHNPGPTVDRFKFCQGRDKFHASNFYDIGPYYWTDSYIIAYYDKEIFYYSHAPEKHMYDDLFKDAYHKREFILTLERERKRIEDNFQRFDTDPVFAFTHGELSCRNILIQNGKIRAITGWGWAGCYPLCEVLRGEGFKSLGLGDDAAEKEGWGQHFENLLRKEMKARGWEEDLVAEFMAPRDPDLAMVRQEMVPVEDSSDGNGKSGDVPNEDASMDGDSRDGASEDDASGDDASMYDASGDDASMEDASGDDDSREDGSGDNGSEHDGSEDDAPGATPQGKAPRETIFQWLKRQKERRERTEPQTMIKLEPSRAGIIYAYAKKR
ncbi:hypothetical protein ACLMJK_005656 [Lecanora helva]